MQNEIHFILMNLQFINLQFISKNTVEGPSVYVGAGKKVVSNFFYELSKKLLSSKLCKDYISSTAH